MVYYYLTTNDNKREPSCLDSISYVRVQGSPCGNNTLIMTSEQINDSYLISKTKQESEIQLQSWADFLNDMEPELTQEQIDNGEIKPVHYPPDINIYLNADNIRPSVLENADWQRILRGSVLPGDESKDFHRLKRNMSPIELEQFERILGEKLNG